jgi:hypothetical protein
MMFIYNFYDKTAHKQLEQKNVLFSHWPCFRLAVSGPVMIAEDIKSEGLISLFLRLASCTFALHRCGWLDVGKGARDKLDSVAEKRGA